MLDIGQAVRHQLLAMSRPCRGQCMEIPGDHGVGVHLAAPAFQDTQQFHSLDRSRCNNGSAAFTGQRANFLRALGAGGFFLRAIQGLIKKRLSYWLLAATIRPQRASPDFAEAASFGVGAGF